MDAWGLLSAGPLAAHPHLPHSVRRIAMAVPSRCRPWVATCGPAIAKRKGKPIPPPQSSNCGGRNSKGIMTGKLQSEEVHQRCEAVQHLGQSQLCLSQIQVAYTQGGSSHLALGSSVMDT